ncbi:hypothetical protein [Bacteroides neonati]|uniref:hypothetical protein n=1 Tax=Bacteroides neonati TaxID=1347393 RepID=UPI0004B5ECC0|nr:hypothetical protein [Bacteroides neonati]
MNALSKLKVSYIEGLIANPFYVRKLINRRSNVILSCLLTQAYSHFTTMMLHRSLAVLDNNSYEEAEKSAILFDSLFALDVKPEDMLHKTDEETNKSLDDYEKLCHNLNALEKLGIEREVVIAFCKQVEYGCGNKLARYRVQCNFHYTYYAEATFLYLLDLCSYEEMMGQFFEYSLFTKKRSPAKVRRFIKDLRMALDLFNEITQKRNIRTKCKL